MEQEDLEKILKDSDVDSKEYKRANNEVLRIQLDTNNKQTANLIGEVRFESQKAEKHAGWALGINFFTLLVAIIAAGFAYQQLKDSDTQLQQLNAKAQIQIGWIVGDSHLTLQATTSNPFTFSVVPNNIGSNDTSYWQVTTLFCNGVKILNHNQNWMESPKGSNWLYFKSNQPLLHDRTIFDEQENSIGYFTITFPVKPVNLPASVPLAFVQTSGQQTLPIGEYIYLQIDSPASSSIEYDYNYPVVPDAIKSGCIEQG